MLGDKPLVDVRFPRGKNNVSRETELPEGAARELLNVDLTNSGELSRRRGYTSVYSSGGASVHSLFSTDLFTLFAQSGTLKQLNPDYSASTIRAGLDPNLTLSYAAVNNLVYYSNGRETGIVMDDTSNAEWGVDAPLGQPSLGSGVGFLDAGAYQVAVTYLSSSGEESGSPRAVPITVPVNSSINITSIPQSGAAFVNIYVTAANGDMLYLQATVAMGTTTHTVTSLNKGRVLETQFFERMPPGQIVRYFRGRMWVAAGNLLLFSPAMRFGVYDPRFTYFRFPSDIDIMQPVQDGVYVVADKTYFLSGTDPMNMEQTVVFPSGGVRDTGMSVAPSKFMEDAVDDTSQDDVAFWYSKVGAMIGYPAGQVKSVTDDRLAMSHYDRGATLLREDNGIRQLITSLTDRGEGSGFGATDTAVAEVRRNGVVI